MRARDNLRHQRAICGPAWKKLKCQHVQGAKLCVNMTKAELRTCPRGKAMRDYDPPRTRTWNLRLRRPTPYPLGQQANVQSIMPVCRCSKVLLAHRCACAVQLSSTSAVPHRLVVRAPLFGCNNPSSTPGEGIPVCCFALPWGVSRKASTTKTQHTTRTHTHTQNTRIHRQTRNLEQRVGF